MAKNDPDKQKLLKRVAFNIISLSRNSLFISLRFLDVALFQFTLQENEEIKTLASDGVTIYYDPKHAVIQYKAEKTTISRELLHLVLHFVFKHPFVKTQIKREYWDLATDIAIEKVISDIHVKQVETLRGQEQKEYLDQLSQKIAPITAEKVYRYLVKSQKGDEEIARLAQLFIQDDHSLWYSGAEANSEAPCEPDSEQQSPSQEKEQFPKTPPNKEPNQDQQEPLPMPLTAKSQENWERISESVKIDLETISKEMADASGALMQNIQAVNRDRYDYASFLKKFAVLGEAMQINDEEFDYIYYTYGLNLYRNIPLIEPLEYKEIKRIKEFVIAIDTSASCSGETVLMFLEKTYSILHSAESFFRKINVRIIQCDKQIQSDYLVTSPEEFDEYIRSMQIKGLGGTDFRPVFTYIDELIEKKEFTNLKGLIYFTDGQGIYPTKKPAYETAFIFLSEDAIQPKVPVWAVKLILAEDDIPKIK